MNYLIELLRSLDFVESVTVQPDVPKQASSSAGLSVFDQFYGLAKTGQTIEQLDQRLNDLRNEWTSDI